MRIVYIAQYFTTPDMNGGARHYEWVSRLVAAGHDVHVITGDLRTQDRRPVTDERGATVRWLPVGYDTSMSIPARLAVFLKFAALAAWHARRVRADVVFASSTPLTVAIPAIAAVLGRPAPMVFEVRDLWPDVPIAMGALRNPLFKAAARALERAAYRHSARVIALSPEMKAGIVRAGFPADSVVLVPNASDIDVFRRPAAAEEGERFRREHDWLGDRPLVLYAGTLGRVNEVSAMVEIAAATAERDPDIRFLIVGKGSEWDAVAELARQRGVLDRTLFMLPSRPREDMPELFAAASITTSFVADIPELAWNSANKVFDGFAAGRPVATNVGGSIGHLLTETQSGLVLSRDPAVAAGQLVTFLRDPEAVARARESAASLGSYSFAREVLFGELAKAIEDARREGRVVRKLPPRQTTSPAAASTDRWWREKDGNEGA